MYALNSVHVARCMRVQPGRSQDWPTVIICFSFLIERKTVLVDNTKTQQKECEIEKCEEK